MFDEFVCKQCGVLFLKKHDDCPVCKGEVQTFEQFRADRSLTIVSGPGSENPAQQTAAGATGDAPNPDALKQGSIDELDELSPVQQQQHEQSADPSPDSQNAQAGPTVSEQAQDGQA